MRRALAVAVLAASACAPVSAPSFERYSAEPDGDPRAVWLAAHNRERSAFGSAPLVWDETLAAQARGYAAVLAGLGRLQHSPKSQRPGQGENLWLGSRRAYVPEAMIASWAGERRFFRRGAFPAVSRTGNWRDVGHYTQIVWPATTRVGCGLASSTRWDVLVCRYSPPGNRDGQRL